MKREIKPSERSESLQAIVNYLVDNGMSNFDAQQFIHTNLPALGEYRNIVDTIRDGKWDEAWSVAELYISGDVF